jgi:predicted unusual protein kinase regulating ubiquinone biosynthesis (AarF/ABC1/UbiB family)
MCRFGSLISCESFHADVHAGNLWLLRDGRVGFIDFGMFQDLSSCHMYYYRHVTGSNVLIGVYDGVFAYIC